MPIRHTSIETIMLTMNIDEHHRYTNYSVYYIILYVIYIISIHFIIVKVSV